MKRFLATLLIIIMFSLAAVAGDSQENLQQLIEEGYLPANADGTLGGQEPIDRLTFANAIAKLLEEMEKNSPQAQEEMLRELTVQLQAELAKMLVQTKQFEESLERLQATSNLAQDDLVEVTVQSQKLAGEIAATYQKLESLEENLKGMEQGYQELQQDLATVEASSKSLTEEIALARGDFQRELAENKTQLEQIRGEIEQAQEISEATFQRQGELLTELEERAAALRLQTQELASLTQGLEQRSKQLGGQLDHTEAALYENVNKLQLELSTTAAQLKYTSQKLELEKQATEKRLTTLDETLKVFEESLQIQTEELAAYQQQSRRRGKLGVAFSAVAIPFLLLLMY